MEAAAAVISVAEVAARVSLRLWKLCDAWHDAPKDVHRLREDLARAHEFYDAVRQGMDAGQITRPGSKAPQELLLLLQSGRDTLSKIESIVDQVMQGQVVAEQPTGKLQPLKIQSLKARRKVVWLAKSDKLHRLKAELLQNKTMIYGELVALNV
jgi:hypothetical protein